MGLIVGVVSAGGGAVDVDMRRAVSGRVAGLDSSDDDSDAGSRKFPAAAVACVGVMESISVAGGSNLEGGDAGSVVACGVDVS